MQTLARKHARTHSDIHMQTCTHTESWLGIRARTRTHADAHPHAQTHTHTRTHARRHTHVHTHAHTPKQTRTHTHARTQTRTCHARTLTHARGYTHDARRGVPLNARVSLVRGETVEVGKKKDREGAWGIVRVFLHIQ
jgi:hypothetical protein